ncbi:peptide/nickel transport system permease protein [Antricoccus suffuscus]|uniref:Peptide/nickel transport system permease protein n=1 Tax=Antricoccus suffuscus TaxID=1629062 RepID=A0A2T0ZZ33_9ACTN|nr:ABC transporter permease [Antricoccus suffuscus]PRZ41600.1 peptide/nickel transport system permease protein [Antricoccus suffuscus]
MIRFLIRRLLTGLIVIWLISVIVFGIFFIAPTNVAQLLLGKFAAQNQQLVHTVTAQLGLDQPIQVQYWHFIVRLFHGDLGFSYYSHEPVTTLIARALPVTASLAIGAAIIWVVLGVLIGILSATRPRTLLDRGATLFALTGLSFPTFVLGLLLLYFLFFQLHINGVDLFPGSGYVPLTQDPAGWFSHLILPWITLAVASMAVYVRLTRGQMLEVYGEDYIRTARAKGLSDTRVTFRHALRAALVPIVTQFGIDVAVLLGGAIVTEQVFGLNGLGRMSVQAVVNQDEPVIIAIVLLAAVFVVLANIIVDLLYAVLDPRVRLT